MKIKLPKEIDEIIYRLDRINAQGFIVGGWVRDTLLEQKPKDIDIFTNLLPMRIQRFFPEGNVLGTAKRLGRAFTINFKGIEISTFRKNGERTEFGTNLKEHCSTCDFTINSMAVDIYNGNLYDYFAGEKDLHRDLLIFVGNPEKRIREDPVRMMRALRFVSTKELIIPLQTETYIKKLAHKIKLVPVEKIQTEFNKLLMGDNCKEALEFLYDTNLALYLFPKFHNCFNHWCGKSHEHDVGTHIILAVANAPKDLITRLTMFFHDQEKPSTYDGEHFFGHEIEGAKLAKQVMKQYKYSKNIIKEVGILIKNHMFNSVFYEDGKRKYVSDKSLRKLMLKLDGNKERMYKLLDVRNADRFANSRKLPDKKLKIKIDKFFVKQTTFKISDLKISGKDVMTILELPSGKKVGDILKQLFDEIYQQPELNTKEHLLKRLEEIKNDTQLESMGMGR